MHSEMRNQKVMASHLQRDAYLYIRQSSMGQVLNNKESAIRQYDFRRHAVALGWQQEQIRIIDCDQGESGAVKDARDGFDQLVADVSMRRAGLVMALEASRLSRNSSDWHRLLEICAFTDTL
ncbi:MAG: recombinase family protein, partial [Planctomycetota bacterium]|nr:recombinase family protein [Planctomycetota bacterium]